MTCACETGWSQSGDGLMPRNSCHENDADREHRGRALASGRNDTGAVKGRQTCRRISGPHRARYVAFLTLLQTLGRQYLLVTDVDRVENSEPDLSWTLP